MKIFKRVQSFSVIFMLSVACLSMPANLPAAVTSPYGSYGFLLNRWLDSNANVAAGILGVLNFDGAGNVSGVYTTVHRDYSISSGSLTGTYSGNPDGSNTVSLNFDDGTAITAAIAVTDGGDGLQILVTGGNILQPKEVISGTGRFQGAQGAVPAGSFGYLLNRWPDANNSSGGTFGLLYLDGAGNVTGSYTTTGTSLFSGGLTGTYSTNSDGTGTMTVTLDIGFAVTFNTVVIDGGAGILMLDVNESGGLGDVISGTARLQ